MRDYHEFCRSLRLLNSSVWRKLPLRFPPFSDRVEDIYRSLPGYVCRIVSRMVRLHLQCLVSVEGTVTCQALFLGHAILFIIAHLVDLAR